MKHSVRTWIVLLALAPVSMVAQAQSGGSRMVEEQVNPAEVVLRDGKAWYSGRDGFERLTTRTQGGETVYYRKVPAYDPEHGYAQAEDAASEPVSVASGPTSTPQRHGYGYGYGYGNGDVVKYYGNGLYGPDYFRSQYNRDARQYYNGYGGYGSCSRYDGCRGVRYIPYAPVVVPVLVSPSY